MDSIFSALAWGGGVLLTVAVAVACWERWRQDGRRLHASPIPALAHAATVDVDVSALPEPAPVAAVPAIDRRAKVLPTAAQNAAPSPVPNAQAERDAALDAALQGMVRGPAAAASAPASSQSSWVATRPMVLAGSNTPMPGKDNAAAPSAR